jgi:predicted metal-dependent phosphoesterase TrpH
MYEYLGNLHMHSTYSDGSLDIEDIAARAAQAGLDFIIITDHYTLKGLYEKKEGYQQGVLVMIGMEANVSQNHYICLDISQEVKNNDERIHNALPPDHIQKGENHGSIQN